jgi:hypothetical protein
VLGYLLTHLGVSLFFAVRGIAADLHRVNELTEIKNDDNDDKIISEGTEDGRSRVSYLVGCRS